MLGEDNASKLAPLSLLNNTVHLRIVVMSEDFKLHIVAEMKSPPLGIFCNQLDEYTDVSLCAQLTCFVRYIYEGDFKDDFLFCLHLPTTTRGMDIFEKVNEFLSITFWTGRIFVLMELQQCWDAIQDFNPELRHKSRMSCHYIV